MVFQSKGERHMKGGEFTRGGTLTEVMDKSRLKNYKGQIKKKKIASIH